jgi:ArsR family transcriptional regulator
MKPFLRVMKAAADPTRVKMLKMLQHRKLCVCEIYTALGIAQSTASKHLKILEDAGLVKSWKEGLWVNYALTDGADSPYAANLIGNLRHWLEDDPEIVALAEAMIGIHRETICAAKGGVQAA